MNEQSPTAATALPASGARPNLAERFRRVRQQTMRIVAPLACEDMVPQSMPDCSPTAWHLAHTTWFFERFILRSFDAEYTPSREAYDYLFNSYYNLVGPQHCRPRRGLVTRPTVGEVLDYRRVIEDRVAALLEREPAHEGIASVMEVGLNHEQQHQELIVTDIKHLLSCNPMLPALRRVSDDDAPPATLTPSSWRRLEGGIVNIGGDPAQGFRFDNEQPRHRVFLEPFEIAHRPVSNGEYRKFIADDGYHRPELWLSLGWAMVNEQRWTHPLYWFEKDDAWHQYTLRGPVVLREDEPACHLSYFEADAYARWAGARLPTEFEWEHAAGDLPLDGVCAEELRFHPAPLDPREQHPARFFGDVWEWTSSSYAPYPGFETPSGALGEYNGKFMCNQYVLRGGSCATPQSQVRLTYRNFFPPEARWQFAGARLARSCRP